MKRIRMIALTLAVALMMIAPAAATAESESPYPEKLSVFADLSEHIAKTGAMSMNDSYVFQELERITGTKVEWVHPAAGSDIDAQINLMVASQSMTDVIIRHNWKTFGGGAAMWAEDGVIVDITDLIPEYMPNYNKIITDLPFAVKTLSTDGRMYYVSEIGSGYPYIGPIYRGDWLESLNKPVPTTIDELYDVLTAFGNDDPNGNGEKDEWAMTGEAFTGGNFGIGQLLWPFGVHYSFMQIDGKVTYGPLEDEFTEAMTFLNKLYSEGLLDPDYSTQDRNMLDGKYMNDLVGFEYGIQPSKMNNALADTGFKAVGGPNLKREAGAPSYVFHNMYISFVNNFCDAAISTACDEPGKALHWLDYFYSEEGMILSNFGIEGLSYVLDENGRPVYDYSGAIEREDTLTQDEVKYRYNLLGMSTFPLLNSAEAYFSTLHPYSKEAVETWRGDYDISRMIPNVSFTAEETEEINDVLVDIETYITIQFDRLVTGQGSLEEIPEIQQKLRDMGIEKCIEVYQTAYDRFMEE